MDSALDVPCEPTQCACCICLIEHPRGTPWKLWFQIFQDQSEFAPITSVYQKGAGDADEPRSNVPIEVGLYLITMYLSMAAIHAVSSNDFGDSTTCKWLTWGHDGPCACAPRLDRLTGVGRRS